MNRLIKFLFSFSLISLSLSNNCYTYNDVQNNGYVSYNNKVYDIENYIHPGGQDTLLLAKGKPLEDFFNQPQYQFHKTSNFAQNDLKNIYIGDLYQSCGNVTNNNNINIIDNSPVFFSIITGSAFVLLNILTISINNTNLYLFFGKLINLYCLFPSRGEILFYIFYLLWWSSLLYLSLISQELFTNLGIWISLNIAFTLLPMTRNSIWIKILNCPYNSLISVHKFISIFTAISVIIKTVLIIIEYNFYFLFSIFNLTMGTLCTLSILFTVIFALPCIRKNIYELFYYSHRILCIVTIITMSLHYITALYYIIPSVTLYILDLLLRIIYVKKSVYSKMQTYELAYNTKYSILTIKLKNKINIKPGSYFFICCKNISKNQWHPISLMNIKNKGLNFCIKDMGKNSWSNKLAEYHKNYQYLDILLQGPYAHFKLNYNYKYILCVSNGIGITPFFSILDDIKQNKPDILNKILFIWIIPHESFIKPFLNIFDNIDKNLVTVDIYVTNFNDNKTLDEKYYLLLNFYYNKPIIDDCVNNFIVNNFIIDMSEIGIFSCGSPSLTKDLSKTCSKLDINLFNENFS